MKVFLSFIFSFSITAIFAQSIPVEDSKLKTGQVLKMAVVDEGIYKISANDLRSWGISDINAVNPAEIRVFGSNWGDLPQENNAGYPLDPSELAIYMEGESDGQFNEEDFIVFYARGPHRFELTAESSFHALEYNHYADTAYYYLSINGGTSGKRVTGREDLWDGVHLVNTFEKAYYYKVYKYSRIFSGREWYGEFFSASALARLYTFPAKDYALGSNVKIAVGLLGYSFGTASFSLKANGINAGTVEFPGVDDYRYGKKGVLARDTFELASSVFTTDPELIIEFSPNTSARVSEAYMDHIIFQYTTPMNFVGGQMKFASLNSFNHPVSSYAIENGSAITDIWDVTDFYAPISQVFQHDIDKARFGANSQQLRSFVAFNKLSSDLLKPLFVESLSNQNMKGISPADMIIISHKNFLPEAERLAAFRRSNDNLDVEVVNIDQVFNEFSSGRRDVTGIRNFLRYMYRRSDNPGKLKYVLLMGKGTFDTKNSMGYGNNFIPVYQSRNSVEPLISFGSDDYLGILDDDEGFWEESFLDVSTLDIAVGRLPVKNAREAQTVVDKLISYSSNTVSSNEWLNEVLFVADDGDYNIHQSQSYQLVNYVDTAFSGVQPSMLLLDNFEQPTYGGEKSPDMKKSIVDHIEEGKLIVNFTGHGSPGTWMQENVFDLGSIKSLQNIDKLPLFVTATCEFGRHDNPMRVSAGEELLLHPTGGGMGMITTSRPVYSSTNFSLSKVLYREIFQTEQGFPLSLGEVFRRTKNLSSIGTNNRNFALLGDPALKLEFPDQRTVITDINGIVPDNTIDLEGLTKVTLNGEVALEGITNTNFNGKAHLLLYDEKSDFVTLGNENAPFPYKDWNSLLFSGLATVTAGKFSYEFVIPKNIIDGTNKGKVFIYAYDSINHEKASGSFFDLNVSGENVNAAIDEQPPQVDIFLNDNSFRSGNYVPENSTVIVDVYDENGIGISSADQSFINTAILDDSVVIAINDFYSSNVDTYQSGKFIFDLESLSEGTHTLQLKIFDTYNNITKKNVKFIVKNRGNMFVSSVQAYPNPFQGQTTLMLNHNRPGDDLEVNLQIFTAPGNVVYQLNMTYLKANSEIELINEDLSKIDAINGQYGFYMAAVLVKSKTDGVKKISYCKLIYLN